MTSIDRKRRTGRCMGDRLWVGARWPRNLRSVADHCFAFKGRRYRRRAQSASNRSCEERGITEIVVGVPLHMDGSMSEMGEEASSHSWLAVKGQSLKSQSLLRDERLSTVEAERALNAVDSPARRRNRPKGQSRLCSSCDNSPVLSRRRLTALQSARSKCRSDQVVTKQLDD